METWNLGKYCIEYWEDEHIYLVDGLILPSITTILKKKFGNKYDNVSPEVLKKASEKGTNMHQAIQDYEEENIDDLGCLELQNYKFLKKHYGWKVVASEIPVVLEFEGRLVAVGRLDQVIQIDDELGINDLKRTAVFDKEYVAYQTNLYRIAYQQTYGGRVSFVSGTHLRDEKRKFYKLPLDEEKALELVKEYINE